MKILLFYSKSLLLIYFLTGCHGNDTTESQRDSFPKRINLKTTEVISDPVKLSEIAEKVEYIPLQTSDSSLLGPSVNYAVTDDHYFFHYRASVFEFDTDGQFIKSLFSPGRGPGETFARWFTVDEKNELVYVFSNYEHITKVYNYDGTLVNTIKKPIVDLKHWSTDIVYFNNSLIVETWQNNDSKYLLSSFDLRADSIRVIYKDYTHGDKRINFPNRFRAEDAICYQNQDSVFIFKETFCDTIFKISASYKVEPKWIIDVIGNELKRDERIKNYQIGGVQKGYWMRSMAESPNFLFFAFSSESDPRIFGIYNKNIDSIKLVINKDIDFVDWKIFLENDLDKIVNFYPIGPLGNLFYYKGCLYTLVEAKGFVKGYKSASTETKKSTEYLRKMAPVFESINDLSNPVIMKVYLK